MMRDIDSMSEEDKRADLLANVREHGAVRLTNRRALGFWNDALTKLESEGLVKSHLVEVDQQESYLLIEPTDRNNETDEGA